VLGTGLGRRAHAGVFKRPSTPPHGSYPAGMLCGFSTQPGAEVVPRESPSPPSELARRTDAQCLPVLMARASPQSHWLHASSGMGPLCTADGVQRRTPRDGRDGSCEPVCAQTCTPVLHPLQSKRPACARARMVSSTRVPDYCASRNEIADHVVDEADVEVSTAHPVAPRTEPIRRIGGPSKCGRNAARRLSRNRLDPRISRPTGTAKINLATQKHQIIRKHHRREADVEGSTAH